MADRMNKAAAKWQAAIKNAREGLYGLDDAQADYLTAYKQEGGARDLKKLLVQSMEKLELEFERYINRMIEIDDLFNR